MCKSACARGLCVCLCVCKGAWGRQSSPAVWGRGGDAPHSLHQTPPSPSSPQGIPQHMSCCPMGLAGVTEGLPPARGLWLQQGCCLHPVSRPLVAETARGGRARGTHTQPPCVPPLLSLRSGRETGAPWLHPGLISSPRSPESHLCRLLGHSTGSLKVEGSAPLTPSRRHRGSPWPLCRWGIGSQGGSLAWWGGGALLCN